MIDYCNTSKCLRKYILEYFGEAPDFTECNYCSNCNSSTEVTDITTDSQKILSCIKRMNERFGAGLVSDVLKGANSAKIKSLGFDNLSTYGIMKDYSKETIRDLISFLIAEGYIKSIGNKYPILTLDASANSILFENKNVFIKKKISKDIKPDKINKSSNSIFEYNTELFEALRALRKEIARQNGIPPFIVFADTSLKQMSALFPTTEEEFLNISGVGDTKLKMYGKYFLNEISKFVTSHKAEKSRI